MFEITFHILQCKVFGSIFITEKLCTFFVSPHFLVTVAVFYTPVNFSMFYGTEFNFR